MGDAAIVGIFVFSIFALLGCGVWVGLALVGAAFIGIELMTSRPAGDSILTVMWTASSSWALTALPMFIWMGEILFRSRISGQLFQGLSPWMSRLPGGLLHTNIVGCTLFAAVTGSSAATLSTVGKIAIAELQERKYPDRMIFGTLAGAATLGLMIPPSLILIVYGVAINESIAKLFIAGIVPGLLLSLSFMLYIAVRTRFMKGFAPIAEPPMSFRKKLRQTMHLVPLFVLIVCVIGSIYLGYATATEAAIIGVIGALSIAFFNGDLTVKTFFQGLVSASQTSAMIALILAGAAALTLAIGYSGIPRNIAEWIGALDLSRVQLIFALLVFYIIIGCILDGISCVVLTIAVVEPLIRNAGIDPIWFGIFVVLTVEMAQITPPIGFNLFVLQGLTNREIGEIAIAAFPSFLIMLIMTCVVIAFPQLATWLPAHL